MSNNVWVAKAEAKKSGIHTKEDGTVVFKGKFQEAGKVNGRIYPYEVLEKSVNDYANKSVVWLDAPKMTDISVTVTYTCPSSMSSDTFSTVSSGTFDISAPSFTCPVVPSIDLSSTIVSPSTVTVDERWNPPTDDELPWRPIRPVQPKPTNVWLQQAEAKKLTELATFQVGTPIRFNDNEFIE